MRMSWLTKWFGRGRRIDAIKVLGVHIDLTLKAVEELYKGLTNKVKGNDQKAKWHLKRTAEIETKADSKRRSGMREWARGVLPPISREDLMNLTDCLDKIADSAKWSAKLIMVISLKDLPLEIKETLLDLGLSAVKCTRRLSEAIIMMNEDFNVSLTLADEVEDIEEESDDQYNRMRKLLYDNEDMKASTLFFVNDLAHGLESVADYCEDTADLARVIIIAASEA
jgi:predicted phosphate transport protein (TIGR00153 family)